MPSGDRGSSPGLFDRFATKSEDFTSKAWFFLACVALVLLWLPTLFFVEINTAQLLINTPTTVVTFLLVALQANTTKRANAALQTKLNALADGLADVLDDSDNEHDADELRQAVGLEEEEST